MIRLKQNEEKLVEVGLGWERDEAARSFLRHSNVTCTMLILHDNCDTGLLSMSPKPFKNRSALKRTEFTSSEANSFI